MAQDTPTPAAIEGQDVPACRHHWVIQPATGPVSQGVCQVCGQVKEFKNYIEASSWGDDKLTARSRTDGATVAAKAVGYEEGAEEE